MLRKKITSQFLLALLPAVIPVIWLLLWYISTHPQAAPVAAILQLQGTLRPVERVLPTVQYPTDRLFVDQQREGYVGADMRLVVPRMELDCAVMDGVETDTLEQGPGLYDYAQLPSLGNPNVSIAGHRDVFGSPFLQVDKLQLNDKIYLVYGDSVYVYLWESTTIVPPDDWSVIHCDDRSKVTLTSCDPIGTTLNRIIAVGLLQQVDVYEEGYRFV